MERFLIKISKKYGLDFFLAARLIEKPLFDLFSGLDLVNDLVYEEDAVMELYHIIHHRCWLLLRNKWRVF